MIETIGRSCGSATVDGGDGRMWLMVGRWWLKLGGAAFIEVGARVLEPQTLQRCIQLGFVPLASCTLPRSFFSL